MKHRTGFVSNSSSSSFILYGDEREQFQKVFSGVPVVQIEALRVRFAKMAQAEEEFATFFSEQPEWDFLFEPYNTGDSAEMVRALDAIANGAKEVGNVFSGTVKEQVYITAPVDRDDAYNLGCKFQVFMGDL